MFGGCLFAFVTSESFEGLGKIKSYNISIIGIYLSHSIFGVRFLWSCLQVFVLASALSDRGTCYPFFKVLWLLLKKLVPIQSLPVPKPLSVRTLYPHLGRYRRVATLFRLFFKLFISVLSHLRIVLRYTLLRPFFNFPFLWSKKYRSTVRFFPSCYVSFSSFLSFGLKSIILQYAHFSSLLRIQTRSRRASHF